MLFLWLAMLGAVIALRRGEHMRLTAFIRDLRPDRRAWVDAFALMLVSAVLVALVMPTYEHFEDRVARPDAQFSRSAKPFAGPPCSSASC